MNSLISPKYVFIGFCVLFLCIFALGGNCGGSPEREAVREEKRLTGRELYGMAGTDGMTERGDVPVRDNYYDR